MKLPLFEDPITKEQSVSLTIVVITFTVVISRWLVGGMSFFHQSLTAVSVGEVEAWLGMTFLLYFGRGATKAVENVQMAKVAAKLPEPPVSP